MAPRANWKGYLRLSLVSCPILLYPATSDSEKIHFNQINKKTGHRIKMQKVDAESGHVVDAEEIVKGYKSGDNYVEITDEDLEAIEVESTRTINVDQFVPRDEIDDLYIDRPYYVVPDGEVGLQAFGVIREAIKKKGVVGIGRVVLSTREHVIALEPRDNGILGLLLHYPYEIRKPEEYFGDIKKVATPKEMIDLATHIIDTMSGRASSARSRSPDVEGLCSVECPGAWQCCGGALTARLIRRRSRGVARFVRADGAQRRRPNAIPQRQQ
jgi:DNA end-binding protein Ku